jgi:hypothetical protein
MDIKIKSDPFIASSSVLETEKCQDLFLSSSAIII